jgi:aminoglycoside phosphotransferase (APT) family kinase protein
MAKPMPAAEFDITPGLVRRLLAQQHQDLAGLPVEPLASGWDNVTFLLGDKLAVRLPRRAAAAGIILNEQRWLPELAPRLPLPVPVPVRTGVPGAGYPWAWSIVEFMRGTPAAADPPIDQGKAATALGGFFGALHSPAPPDAPANPYRGVPLVNRSPIFTDNLQAVDGLADRDAVAAAWDAALAVPGWDGAPVWLHGDPHPANILINDRQVSGVLDFGDITAGDPACDLSLAWMMIPPALHGEFRSAYEAAANRPLTDVTWARGRGWALNLAVVFLAWSADNPWMHEVGRRALAAVLG